MPNDYVYEPGGRTVANHVRRRIQAIREGSVEPYGKGTASAIVKQAGKPPFQDPYLWAAEFDGLDERLIGRGQEPSRAELAVHLALVCWAVYTKARRAAPARSDYDVPGPVGAATVASSGPDDPLRKRARRIAMADTFAQLEHAARSLAGILGSRGAAVDWPTFAAQVYVWLDPATRYRTIAAWGREATFGRRAYLRQTSQVSNEHQDGSATAPTESNE